MIVIKFQTFRSKILCVLLVCFVLVVICNYGYLKLLTSEETEFRELKINVTSRRRRPTAVGHSVADKIVREYWSKLSFPKSDGQMMDVGFWKDVEIRPIPVLAAWNLAKKMVLSRQVYSGRPSDVVHVLRAMSKAPVLSSDVGSGGTQLKITLNLQGGQKAVFKPIRYSRNTVFTDSVYSGADRHNGEIAAFHLSRILDFRWAPLVVGRKLNVKKELKNVAKKRLKKTFFDKGNGTCFYGVCFYCNVKDAVCEDNEGYMEGAVILWLPHNFQLKTLPHPWRRTYRTDVRAPWETNDGYCLKVMKNPVYQVRDRLLDLIDVAIFDFIIGNGDRHRYEVFENFNDSMVILLDNGKSFGNPNRDEISILAPLYQCCTVRNSTVKRLETLTGGAFSYLLSYLMSKDPLDPILAEPHLAAIDRRIVKVLQVVKYCLQNSRHQSVLR